MKKFLPLLVLVGAVVLSAWYLFTPSGEPEVPPEGGPAVPVTPARRIVRAVTKPLTDPVKGGPGKFGK